MRRAAHAVFRCCPFIAGRSGVTDGGGVPYRAQRRAPLTHRQPSVYQLPPSAASIDRGAIEDRPLKPKYPASLALGDPRPRGSDPSRWKPPERAWITSILTIVAPGARQERFATGCPMSARSIGVMISAVASGWLKLGRRPRSTGTPRSTWANLDAGARPTPATFHNLGRILLLIAITNRADLRQRGFQSPTIYRYRSTVALTSTPPPLHQVETAISSWSLPRRIK